MSTLFASFFSFSLPLTSTTSLDKVRIKTWSGQAEGVVDLCLRSNLRKLFLLTISLWLLVTRLPFTPSLLPIGVGLQYGKTGLSDDISALVSALALATEAVWNRSRFWAFTLALGLCGGMLVTGRLQCTPAGSATLISSRTAAAAAAAVTLAVSTTAALTCSTSSTRSAAAWASRDSWKWMMLATP